jgi:Telomerase reverse transcriptase, C-terminal extension
VFLCPQLARFAAIAETVTVLYGVPKEGAPRVGDSFRRKVPQYLKPRCQPILLDAQVNSVFTVHLNIYQAFLYCAIKFHANAIALPQPPPANESFFLDCINDVLLYMHQIIEQLRQDSAISQLGFRCPVSAAAVNWLGAHAFTTILTRKQTRYPGILSALRKFCSDPRRRALEQKLCSVILPEHSLLLVSQIHY